MTQRISPAIGVTILSTVLTLGSKASLQSQELVGANAGQLTDQTDNVLPVYCRSSGADSRTAFSPWQPTRTGTFIVLSNQGSISFGSR